MQHSPNCRRCGYCLRGLSVDGHCPECNLPITDSFWRAPSRAATVSLAATALMYPILMWFVFDPSALLGYWFPLIACVFSPATLFGLAFALSAAGIRFHRWAVVLLIILVVLTSVAAYFVWAVMIWGA